jgi:DNA-directed RNA polymerase subunit beta
MSTMTRISPVGKAVSGIPDKRAIYAESRNTHPSYYGNIDPLDTPESGNIGIVQQLTIDAALASSRGLIKQKPINNNEKSGMLSTTSVLTPFIENDDGARVIMITNQAKQMLPLKNPQPPPVMTGYESILTNFISDNFVKKASCNGPIVQVTTDFIVINCNGKKVPIDITPIHLRSGSGINTLSVFKPVVKVGDVVKRGDVIAEGACIADGSIATGRPLLVAVMPYMGYTFEDGLMISDKLVKQDLLTSLHGIEEVVVLEENDKLVSIAELGQYTEKGQPLIRKIHGNIDQLLGTDEDESEEIFAGQYVKKSPGGRIVDIEVFSNLPDNKFPKLQPLIDRTNKKFGKPTKEKFKYSGETVSGILIRFRIEQELKIGEGDKLCNRHGNKGIITKVGEEKMMPRLPNGEHVDMILNPIGIVGRMNPGQLYEMYCGLICKEMAVRILNSKTKEDAIEIIYKVYSKLDTSKNHKFTTTLMGGLKNLSPANFKKMLENIKKNGFYPLIIPPFSAPNNDKIKEALNVLNLKTGYKLFLPELNTYTQSEVPIGYMYIAKLEHIGANKIYARSTGPVTGKTAQPTSGKRREGGQRVGELDTYSFISYNCPAVLAELMGPLSDDYSTKEEILSDIIQNGHAEYRPAKVTPAKDLLNAYFISLMLNRR